MNTTDAIHAVLDDDQWEFAGRYLRDRGPRERTILAVIIWAVTTRMTWSAVPDILGVTPVVAQRRFDQWTETGLWQQLADAAAGTPHAKWTRKLATDAAARVSAGQDMRVSEPSAPTAADYAEARDVLNRTDGW